MNSIRFSLPPRGSFTPNGEDDPLKYYYIPLVGQLYIARIAITLQLLNRRHFNKTLEIGYGSGILLPTLCKISQEVYGVDLTSNPNIVSKQLTNFGCQATLSQGVSDRLLFEDNTFDLIVAISVLEHIREIKDFLWEIHRVLKPGGILLVGMPAVSRFMQFLFQAIGFSGIENHHVTTPESMLQAAQSMYRLKAASHLPGFLPSSVYLYKSFCFEK
ncbi:MAG TPA: class I SAM-dependent methyltransferase [Crinalium sp.]|jgi:ubiquinone/menaquinone biosynthesis C-methylase UbiE